MTAFISVSKHRPRESLHCLHCVFNCPFSHANTLRGHCNTIARKKRTHTWTCWSAVHAHTHTHTHTQKQGQAHMDTRTHTWMDTHSGLLRLWLYDDGVCMYVCVCAVDHWQPVNWSDPSTLKLPYCLPV